MSALNTNNSGCTLTVNIVDSCAGNGVIPYAFVNASGPDLAPFTVSYYPKVTGVSGAGTVRKDAPAPLALATCANSVPSQQLTFVPLAQQFTQSEMRRYAKGYGHCEKTQSVSASRDRGKPHRVDATAARTSANALG